MQKWFRRNALRPERFPSLSIRSKVFLPPLAAMLVLGALFYVHAGIHDRQRAELSEALRQQEPLLARALALPQHLFDVRSALARGALPDGAGDEGPGAGFAARRASVERELAELTAQAGALARAEAARQGEEGADAGPLARSLAAYRTSVAAALDAIEREPRLGARAVARTDAAAEDLARRLADLAARTSRSVEDLAAREAQAQSRVTRIDVLVSMGAGMLVLLGALLAARSIARPLERLLESIRHLRRGDLDVEIPMTGRGDEFGEVARAVARFREILIERRMREAERERQREALDHMAHHDTLTGLPNRPLTERFLSRAFADRRDGRMPLALLVLDLDGFKPINDAHGHAAGDAVLVEVARRLAGVVREGDLAARIGGDEFAIVLSRVRRREDVERLARRVASALDAPIEWEGRSLLVGGSIGGALTTDTEPSVAALFAAADAAMYAAKEDPAARWTIFVPAGEEREEDRVPDLPELEQAIRGGRIVACFQQVVRLDDGGHAGFTVHMHWRHPQNGLVPIAAVLPDIEKAGLAGVMTIAGLRSLLATLQDWLDEGREPGRVSIIPPPAMLASDAGMRELEWLLAEFPQAAERLTVEVPESALGGRAEAAILRALPRLRERGLRTAIGGFGRCQGALALLGRGAFDEIRISSRIVAGLGARAGANDGPGREAELLVRAFAGVAAGLGIDVLGRGVATEEQEEALRRLGCRFATGERYGGPMLDAAAAGDRLGSPRPRPSPAESDRTDGLALPTLRSLAGCALAATAAAGTLEEPIGIVAGAGPRRDLPPAGA